MNRQLRAMLHRRIILYVAHLLEISRKDLIMDRQISQPLFVFFISIISYLYKFVKRNPILDVV
jgi:hypothetical protein